MSDIKSKGGATIEKGDTVNTPVEQIVTDDNEAQNLGVKGTKHAPAVVFTDQNNKKVAHKPGTVTDLDKES
ncbi:hypothetical protein LTR67_002837 [Exophiala xenobiotica]|nr:hypothetical protein LTR40_007480 [Exophiala xenobiotica]KAK5384228.1 hypothetical protein LTS13_002421 [Exophiala xenobiotica]KAK5399452.1 hypothetical protein LTR79_003089 [Exophiala xenobiotica]KAK5416461.1 hypothetical protein LTR90_005682 [Exophiala xenobiotica]KAK5457884.1 hypothetical protein LTR20_008631 [Exophiala xenobiotica]